MAPGETLKLLAPNTHGIRGQDDYGNGHYGASRDGGTRMHLGIDFAGLEGEHLRMPLRGRLDRLGYAYPDNLTLRSLHLVSLDDPAYMVKLLYVIPKDGVPGEEYEQGDYIGDQATLQKRYPGIIDHVHLELWLKKPEGPWERLDPTPFLIAEEA